MSSTISKFFLSRLFFLFFWRKTLFLTTGSWLGSVCVCFSLFYSETILLRCTISVMLETKWNSHWKCIFFECSALIKLHWLHMRTCEGVIYKVNFGILYLHWLEWWSTQVLLQVASVTFDLLLLLVLGSYLIVLFSFLVITTRVSTPFLLTMKCWCNFSCLLSMVCCLQTLHENELKLLNWQLFCSTGPWWSY